MEDTEESRPSKSIRRTNINSQTLRLHAQGGPVWSKPNKVLKLKELTMSFQL